MANYNLALRLTSPCLSAAAAFVSHFRPRPGFHSRADTLLGRANCSRYHLDELEPRAGSRYYRLYSIPAGGTAALIGESRGANADWWVFPIKGYGQPLRFAIEAVSESGLASRRVTSNEVVPERTTLGASASTTGNRPRRRVQQRDGDCNLGCRSRRYRLHHLSHRNPRREPCGMPSLRPHREFVDNDAVSGSDTRIAWSP